MTRNWHQPDRSPTPAELAAWVEGELDPADADRVESWLLAHPEAEADLEAGSRLVGLFRDHPPAEPSPLAWKNTFDRIASRAEKHRPRWQALLYLALGAAAAILIVLGARLTLPAPSGPPHAGQHNVLPPDDNNDEPFLVAQANEVNILQMDARDADRVMIGQPLLDSFEVVASEDIELVSVEIDWQEGTMPHLQRGARFPMVIVARADEEP